MCVPIFGCISVYEGETRVHYWLHRPGFTPFLIRLLMLGVCALKDGAGEEEPREVNQDLNFATPSVRAPCRGLDVLRQWDFAFSRD